MHPIQNEKGFQLFENLLSITLLSIVFLVFFGFFIQSNNFTAQNQSSSSASQLSQEILEKVRGSELSSDNAHNEIITTTIIWNNTNLTLENWRKLYPNETITGEFTIKVNSQTFYPVVKMIKANTYSTLFNLTPSFPDGLDLIVIQIYVEKNGERVKVYETYGYKVRG